ncbi:unnamed protein product [Linum trigynum]|uniref:Uncharacterized protein n=1 Tax=Linum trigynum TaxID=586398 RepID=A0AAV2FZP5_9ROSI
MGHRMSHPVPIATNEHHPSITKISKKQHNFLKKSPDPGFRSVFVTALVNYYFSTPPMITFRSWRLKHSFKQSHKAKVSST